MIRENFIAALVAAALSASADASPFGPDHGFDAAYTAVENAREEHPDGHPDWLADVFEHPINPETRAEDERSSAFVPRAAPLPGSGETSPEAFHQPSNRKE